MAFRNFSSRNLQQSIFISRITPTYLFSPMYCISVFLITIASGVLIFQRLVKIISSGFSPWILSVFYLLHLSDTWKLPYTSVTRIHKVHQDLFKESPFHDSDIIMSVSQSVNFYNVELMPHGVHNQALHKRRTTSAHLCDCFANTISHPGLCFSQRS